MVDSAILLDSQTNQSDVDQWKGGPNSDLAPIAHAQIDEDPYKGLSGKNSRSI